MFHFGVESAGEDVLRKGFFERYIGKAVNDCPVSDSLSSRMFIHLRELLVRVPLIWQRREKW